MLNVQFDMKQINRLKDILLRLRHGETVESVQADFNQYFKNISVVDILLIELELLNGNYGITINDVKKLSNSVMNKMEKANNYQPSHPVQVFKEENTAFQDVLNQINHLLKSFEQNQMQELAVADELKHNVFRLGEFHNHYHRKEKLLF